MTRPAAERGKLDEHDKNEWWDICRALKPSTTWEQFEELWADFQTKKAERLRRKELS